MIYRSEKGWTLRSCQHIVIPALREHLEKFSRDELRDYAEQLGVERGHKKSDVVENLVMSGKATLCVSLGD